MKNEIFDEQLESKMLEVVFNGSLKTENIMYKSLEMTNDILEVIRQQEMKAAYKLSNYIVDRYCQISWMKPLYEKTADKKTAKDKRMRLVVDENNNAYSVIFHILKTGKWVLNFKKDDTIINVIDELRKLCILSHKFTHPKDVGYSLFWQPIYDGDPRKINFDLIV